jgi:hypothetical protein
MKKWQNEKNCEMKTWQNEKIEEWKNGEMKKMAIWKNFKMSKWQNKKFWNEKMEEWKNGKMKKWRNEKMAKWKKWQNKKNGKMKKWWNVNMSKWKKWGMKTCRNVKMNAGCSLGNFINATCSTSLADWSNCKPSFSFYTEKNLMAKVYFVSISVTRFGEIKKSNPILYEDQILIIFIILGYYSHC